MRTLPFLAVLILVISCQSSPTDNSTSTTVVEEEIVEVVANAETSLKVEGMMCEVGCVGTIEKALYATAGVSSCDIDFENATALVRFDSTQIATAEIVDVINGLAEGHYTATAL